MNKIKLGINFSGPKPLSEKARQWVMEQSVYFPIYIQIVDAMYETETTIRELSSAVDIREATISDFINQKSQMTAENIDAIFKYLMKKK